MNQKDIKKLYEKYGIEYLPEDWGKRSDTGEGLENLPDPDRHSNTSSGWFAGLQDDAPFKVLWRARTEGEQEEIEALDEFFAPYLIRLPLAKQNLIHDYMGWRKTQTDIGREVGVSQQAVSKDLHAAVRALTRLVAEDDPMFERPRDNRRRSRHDENDAAMRVLNAWWFERFGYERM